MRTRLAACALAVLAFAACSRPEPHRAGRRHISIAAAADLKFALDDLVAACGREHPDIAVTTTYGSSGNFYSQIVNGAPFDLFLSADAEYPRRLAERSLTLPNSYFLYAVGRLAVWVPASSSIDVSRGITVAEHVAHVAIANPAHAPYGRAAIAALRSAGLLDAVTPKLVYGENVGQALQFAQSGGADVAIIALSLAVAPPVRPTGRYAEVSSSSFPPITQGGAIMKRTADADAAWTMRSFLVSDEAGTVLRRYGFAVPERP